VDDQIMENEMGGAFGTGGGGFIGRREELYAGSWLGKLR
jgi:hypothetical protein